MSPKLTDQTSKAPDSAASSFEGASPVQMKDVDQNTEMLRLLGANGITNVSMLEELLRRACQPKRSTIDSATSFTNMDKILGSQDSIASSSLIQELEPNHLEGYWNTIREGLSQAIIKFIVFGAGAECDEKAQFSKEHHINHTIFLRSVFGTDPEEQTQLQHHMLCKIHHVLYALLGKVIHSTATRFNFEHFKIEILDVMARAPQICHKWMSELRPHLLVVYGQGSGPKREYPGFGEAFTALGVELEKAIVQVLLLIAHLGRDRGYEPFWIAMQTKFDLQSMSTMHQEHGDKVFLTFFPGLKRIVGGNVEILCKAHVLCTLRQKNDRMEGEFER